MTIAMPVTRPRGVDKALIDARRWLRRLDPHEAFDAQRHGAVLVDTRPQINRDLEGTIPGALIIERNVLEWRLDPSSDACVDVAAYNAHLIVICNEGYASSFAAVALQALGLCRATDMIGGYRGWRSVGLPIDEPVLADDDELELAVSA
jgi:rhodanese-related sulfurtransferase